jgi:hypothetical protein
MALAGVCLAAWPCAGSALPDPVPSTDTAPGPASEPAGPGKAIWAANYAEARERALRDGRVVFVEFSEKNCGNCIRMHGLIYPAVNFEMMLLRMVPVNVDRLGAEGAALATRYGVTESPAVLILSPGGALIFRVNGFDSAPEFYSRVHSMMAEWDKLNVRMIHEPEFRDDPTQELALGSDLAYRLDPEEAIPRFARAAESPRADAATREKALTLLASARLNAHLFSDARATTEKLARVARDRDLREQAEIFLGQISLARAIPPAPAVRGRRSSRSIRTARAGRKPRLASPRSRRRP